MKLPSLRSTPRHSRVRRVPGPSVRPLEAADIDAVHEISVEAFQDLNRRFGEPPEPAGPIAATRVRLRPPAVRTDPGGAWVAERDGARRRLLAGASCARASGACRCSSCRPEAQSSGVGRELLAPRPRVRRRRARPDHALLARPARAAQLRPARPATCTRRWRRAAARGARRRRPRSAPGTLADLPLTAEVDRARPRRRARRRHRGAARVRRRRCWCCPERGYAVVARRRDRPAARRARRGRRGDAPARLPGRRRRPRGVRRVDHQRPALGGRAVPRGRAWSCGWTSAPCSSPATSGRSRPYLPSGAYL